MTIREIAKELEEKGKQRDKKGVLKQLKKIPDLYPPLIDHPNLQVLQNECSKLKAKVKDWKWPSLTDTVYDTNKESFIRGAEGKPVLEHQTIINDIFAFADLLRSFTKKGGRITKAEANTAARPRLKKNPKITARKLAKEIGCSAALICKTPAWQAVQEKLKKGRKPKAQRLTKAIEKTTPAEKAKLRKLFAQQERDAKEDAPQGKQRKVYPSL